MDEHAVPPGGAYRSFYRDCGQSWRAYTMSQLLPYETIIEVSEGDPEAVAAVLSHYAGYIRACSSYQCGNAGAHRSKTDRKPV
jgi:hypothetical protein